MGMPPKGGKFRNRRAQTPSDQSGGFEFESAIRRLFTGFPSLSRGMLSGCRAISLMNPLPGLSSISLPENESDLLERRPHHRAFVTRPLSDVGQRCSAAIISLINVPGPGSVRNLPEFN